MPTIKVILNPVSGRGAGQQTAEVIRHTLTEAKTTFEIVETTEQLSAVAQAAQAVREGWDIIAVAGGDGTANEVLNGIIEASLGTPTWEAGEPAANALGLIPIGTGNDFAWCMGAPIGDVAAACWRPGRRGWWTLGTLLNVGLSNQRRYLGVEAGLAHSREFVY